MPYYTGVMPTAATKAQDLVLTINEKVALTYTGTPVVLTPTSASNNGIYDNIKLGGIGGVRIGPQKIDNNMHDIFTSGSYHLFVFPEEVFFVVNYMSVYYQWFAFGTSTVAGMPSGSEWYSASIAFDSHTVNRAIVFYSDGSGSASSGITPALFAQRSSSYGGGYYNTSRIHNKTQEGSEWPGPNDWYGVSSLQGRLKYQPNEWNSEALLYPLRGYMPRPENLLSLGVEVQNARQCRIDYLEPGEIVTLGPDKWMVFPWFKKTPALPNGTVYNASGGFGWVIKYEGD